MRTYVTALVTAVALLWPSAAATAQGPIAKATLEHYEVELAINPDNAFYQYAVVQTRRRLQMEEPESAVLQGRRPGRWQVQAYEMTTGALAVQESLQLDRLAGAGDETGPAVLPIADVPGVSGASIPFEKLMKGRTPVVEPLAKAAPADWYYAHFPHVSSLRTVLDAAGRWGGHLLSSYAIDGRDARLREKLERQLLLHATPDLDAVYDLAVGDVAIVGSDPFFAEGTDVTVIFSVKNALLFGARMEMARRTAVAAAEGKVSVLHEPYRAWTVDGVVSADRSLSNYLSLKDGIGIVSTSLDALRRVADTVDGVAPAMAAADDFKYMRAVKPYSENDEDGFLFLSDAFVRRVVGPELKIGEARRVRCAVSLQSAAFATMMLRAELGREPRSIDDLVEARYLDPASLRCPDGGTYSLRDGVPVCSVHNRLGYLKPNLEIKIERVSAEEVAAYDQFRENYSSYWRRYVDPVGVRVRTRQGTVAVEASILPLVENSIYSEMSRDLGTRSVSLARPQLPTAVATVDVKLPPLAEDGPDAPVRGAGRFLGVDAGRLFGRALGDHASVQLVDARPVLALDMAGALGGTGGGLFDDWLLLSPILASLALPTAVVAPVKDRAELDAVLAEFRANLAEEGRQSDGWVRVGSYQLVQGGARTVEAVTVQFLVLEWRVFYAVVGDYFVIATDRDLIDRMAEAAPSDGESGHLRFELTPERWKQILPSVELAYEEDARLACLANVGWLEALHAAYPSKAPYELDGEALALLGATFTCPDNARYVASDDGTVSCALHGTRRSPRQGPRPQPGSPAAYVLERVHRMRATLTLTEDGLESRIGIE